MLYIKIMWHGKNVHVILGNTNYNTIQGVPWFLIKNQAMSSSNDGTHHESMTKGNVSDMNKDFAWIKDSLQTVSQKG